MSIVSEEHCVMLDREDANHIFEQMFSPDFSLERVVFFSNKNDDSFFKPSHFSNESLIEEV